MPTLFRFLLVIAVLAALGFAAMFSLATMVNPEPREISTPIPSHRLPRHRADEEKLAVTGALHAGLFIDMLASERGAARNTLDAYRRDLGGLSRLPEGNWFARPTGPRPRHVRGFMASLEERGLKASVRGPPAVGGSPVPQASSTSRVTRRPTRPPRSRPRSGARAAESSVGRARSTACWRSRRKRPPARRCAGSSPAGGPDGLPARTPLRHRPSGLRLDRAATQRRRDPRTLPRGARQGREGAPRAPRRRYRATWRGTIWRCSKQQGKAPAPSGCSLPTAKAAT